MNKNILKTISKEDLAELVGLNIAKLKEELETLENLMWLLVGKS